MRGPKHSTRGSNYLDTADVHAVTKTGPTLGRTLRGMQQESYPRILAKSQVTAWDEPTRLKSVVLATERAARWDLHGLDTGDGSSLERLRHRLQRAVAVTETYQHNHPKHRS